MDPDAGQVLLDPPVGSGMAYLSAQCRLIGFLVPPSGTTELCLSLGVIDDALQSLLQDGSGLSVELVTGADRVSVLDGSALLPLADPEASWSGFSEHCLALPPAGADGFWIVIAATGFAHPVHQPELLIDELRFQ